MEDKQSNYDIEQIKKENGVLRKYAAIQAAAEEKVGCQKIYIDIAGSLEAAFVLDELIYFTLPRPGTGRSGLRVWKDGVLWMAVSRAEWWERKRLTPKQADGAIERLVESALIFKELFLFNKQKTTHLRLNTREFFRRYTEELEKQNPPEDSADTMQKDISDLYEMLGVPKGDTPKTPPEMGEGIPKGDTVSPNGDSYNTPHTPPTPPNERESDDSQIFTALENLTGGLNTETPRFVDNWKEKHTTERILQAIALAKTKGRKPVQYVDSILIGWEANGYPKTREQQVQERRNKKTHDHNDEYSRRASSIPTI